jgi:hypothetical protein
VVEGNICSCFHPVWKPTSCAMVTKVLQIISWVFGRNVKSGSHRVNGMCGHAFKGYLKLKNVVLVQIMFETL